MKTKHEIVVTGEQDLLAALDDVRILLARGYKAGSLTSDCAYAVWTTSTVAYEADDEYICKNCDRTVHRQVGMWRDEDEGTFRCKDGKMPGNQHEGVAI